MSYYPGCSLEGTGKEYALSALSVCKAFGFKLTEVEDWNCCGGLSANKVDPTLGLALPARNLARAQNAGLDVLVTCAACYNRLRSAEYALRQGPKQARMIENLVGFSFNKAIKVYSLLEVLSQKVEAREFKVRVKRPLTGLRVVCYYGCLLVRPPSITGFDNPENPTSMDELMTRLGAEVRPWSYKTECCGAMHSVINPGLTEALVARLLRMAQEAGADALVTACPLCHTNLEMRRPRRAGGPPCFYFTELVALAFDLPETLSWLSRHWIEPVSLLRRLSLVG
jgi:heterodisulfide reductase subunit B